MRKNRLIALIGTLTMAAAGVAAVSVGSKEVTETKAWTTSGMEVRGDWNSWAGDKMSGNSNDANVLVYVNASSNALSFKLHSTDNGETWLGNTDYGFHKDWSGPAEVTNTGGNMKITPNIVSSGRVELDFHFYNEYDGNWNRLFVYQKAAYTLSFNSNGGSSVSSIEKGTGASIIKPTDPTKTNCTFGGWYSNEGLTNAVSWPYTLSGNATLYAKWDAIATNYTVSFDGNGADSGSMSSESTAAASPYSIPTNEFVKHGYTFAGWATSSDGNVVYDDEDTIPAGTYAVGATPTLYAKWTKVADKTIYFTTVDWGSDTHIYGWYNDNTYPFGSFPGTKVESSQYLYTNNQGQEIYSFVIPGDLPHVMFAKDDSNKTGTLDNPVDGTAYWYTWDGGGSFGTWTIQHDVTITYNSNFPEGTGTESTKTETAYRNENHTLSTDPFAAPSGYVFGGWYANAACTGTKYVKGNVYQTGDSTTVNLYAKWLEEIADGYYVKNFTTGALTFLPGTSPNYSGSVTVALNDTFKVVKYENYEISNEHYWGYNNLAGTAKGTQLVDDGTNDHNIKVAKAGTYDVAMNSSSGVITINAITVEHTYTIANLTAGGDPVQLTLNKDSEYKATGLNLNAGDVLAVYDSEDGGTPAIMTMHPKAISNNNCLENTNGETVVVVSRPSSDVYVDVSANTIFVDGFVIGSFYMVVTDSNSIDYVLLKHNETPQSDCEEYLTEGEYAFTKNDVISYINTGSSEGHIVPFDVATVDEASLNANFATSGGKIACTETTNSFAYLKLGKEAHQGENSVYFGNLDVLDAINYAKDFISTMGSVCAAPEGEDDWNYPWSDDIATNWGTNATAFATLKTKDAAAAKILTEATSTSSYEEIRHFAAFYDYIYSKYHASKSAITDFALRFVENGAGVNYFASSNRLISVNDVSTSTWIIASVAIVGIAAVGVFFIYRKRKEN